MKFKWLKNMTYSVVFLSKRLSSFISGIIKLYKNQNRNRNNHATLLQQYYYFNHNKIALTLLLHKKLNQTEVKYKMF